jgi:hypothetical protein
MRAAPLQWDLRTYLAATRATLAGINPYRVENLADFAGRGVLPFVYPLPALVFFLPLIPLATAPAAFIGVKLALLAGLVAGWAKALRPVRAVLPLALLAVFGWNGAALWDLRAGNVAIVECGLLWGAFACFVAGRRAAFAALVVMAATFKVFPLAFLLLLLVPAGGSGPRPWLLAGSLAAFVAAVVAPMRIGPAAGWEPFFAHVPMVNTIGEANPSAIGFATLALQRLVNRRTARIARRNPRMGHRGAGARRLEPSMAPRRMACAQCHALGDGRASFCTCCCCRDRWPTDTSCWRRARCSSLLRRSTAPRDEGCSP